jgi:hypothetical protein
LLVLWAMRLSAKLNLFLGVPILHDQFLPGHLRYLGSFFNKGRLNFLFPIVITGSTIVTTILVGRALATNASTFDTVGFALLATLMALAVIEHWFMVLPLPVERLWSWGMRSRSPPKLTVVSSQMREGSNRVERESQAHESRQTAAKLTARQKLEDRFRQDFIKRNAQVEATSIRREAQQAPVANGRGR